MSTPPPAPPPVVTSRLAVSIIAATCMSPGCRRVTREIPAAERHLAVTVRRAGERPQRFSVCGDCYAAGRAGQGIDWAATA